MIPKEARIMRSQLSYLILVMALAAATQSVSAGMSISFKVGNTQISAARTKPANLIKVERPEGSAALSPVAPPVIHVNDNGDIAKAANKVADLQQVPLDAINDAAKASAELPQKAAGAAVDAVVSPFKRMEQQLKQAYSDLVSRVNGAIPWVAAGVCRALLLVVFLGSFAAGLALRAFGRRA